MPIPAILGLPWLAEVLLGALGALVTWIATYVGKRVALLAAAVAALAALTAAFFGAIVALIAGVAYSCPPELANMIALWLPPNFPACAAAVAAGEMLRWGYAWNARVILARAS
jgi:hypothetical protein